MTTSTGVALTTLLRAVAAWGLEGRRHAWPARALGSADWSAFVHELGRERLFGLAAAAAAAGALPTTAEQKEELGRRELDTALSNLLLEAATVQVVDRLARGGVAARVLKGPAVAHLDYPDPGWRQFSDVDVLVRSEDFDAAVRVLSSTGHGRRYPEPRPGFDRRFSKGTSFVTEQGVEIDLHRTFAMGPFGLSIRTADLWRVQRPFELGGRPLAALGDEARLLHACYHAALGNVVPRLVPLRDIAQMLARPGLPTDAVLATAQRWGGEPVVARALRCADEALGLEDSPLVAWARRYPLSRRDERRLWAYADPEGGYAGKSIAAIGALPTWHDRAAFVFALAFPQRSYVQQRYPDRGARWRQGYRALRRLATRA